MAWPNLPAVRCPHPRYPNVAVPCTRSGDPVGADPHRSRGRGRGPGPGAGAGGGGSLGFDPPPRHLAEPASSLPLLSCVSSSPHFAADVFCRQNGIIALPSLFLSKTEGAFSWPHEGTPREWLLTGTSGLKTCCRQQTIIQRNLWDTFGQPGNPLTDVVLLGRTFRSGPGTAGGPPPAAAGSGFGPPPPPGPAPNPCCRATRPSSASPTT